MVNCSNEKREWLLHIRRNHEPVFDFMVMKQRELVREARAAERVLDDAIANISVRIKPLKILHFYRSFFILG